MKSNGLRVLTGSKKMFAILLINTLNRTDRSDQQGLAMWLHEMRDLKLKLTAL